MKRFVIIASLFFSFCCCCSAEEFIKGMYDLSTTQTKVSGDDFFTLMMGEPTTKPSGIKDFQGVEINTLSYRNYYLRYEADQEFVLDLIASMPASPSSQLQSDATCKKSLESIASSTFLPSDFNKVDEIDFWRPSEIEEPEYHTCLKVPFSHTILFGKESNIVYHIVEEIIDY